MNKLAWINQQLQTAGLPLAPELTRLLQNGRQKRPPYYFLDAREGALNMDITNKDFPSRHCIPIAKRYDDDNLICIVVSDPERPPGTVIDVHFTARPGSEIDADFASMDIWARLASDEIDESNRSGMNAPIEDLLREDE